MSFQYEHIQAGDEEEFVRKGTKFLEQRIEQVVAERGCCTLGLSGGSTPREIYTKLGKSQEIDWTKVTVFLVDERYVPSGHKESNEQLIRETLLKHAKISPQNLVFPDTTLPVDRCVQNYEERLKKIFKEDGPDVIVLGLGPDGHIASLFPGDVDAILEQKRTVLHTQTDRFAIHDRITVTLPILTNAHTQIFLLKGEEKKKIFAETLSSNTDPIEHPAHALLETGRTVWVTQW